jgi:hypothetical protein
MNKRQKRLCRALLDFYDASGAQPCPLAQLAKKTSSDPSDIYDKDSQSGDLWPFDAKARGSYAGMLSFSSGKNPAVTITAQGLIELEKLCADEPSLSASGAKTNPSPKAPAAPAEGRKRTGHTAPAVSVTSPSSQKTASTPAHPPAAKAVPKQLFTAEDVAQARLKFAQWLKSDSSGKMLLLSYEGQELVDAAFEKFFSEFLMGKDV